MQTFCIPPTLSQLWENVPEILYAFPDSSDAGIIISLICYVEG